jgi:FMN hydrolase / 5-amino-6-(5-phospho-D-ribitylamino)uracil phosphatase
MIELISLDLDDTLWDAGPVLIRAEEVQYAWLQTHAPRITAQYDIPTLQQYRRELAHTEPALRHDFTALRIAALTRLLTMFDYDPSLAENGVEAFLDARSTVELYPEIDACLRDLARHYRLVALTNGNTDLVRAGVAHYFECCIAPSNTGTSKPDPRMFAAVAARTGVDVRAMVHVGDEPLYDIEGAHRAEVSAVWVNRHGRQWPDTYRPAAAEIADLRELRRAIERIELTKSQDFS